LAVLAAGGDIAVSSGYLIDRGMRRFAEEHMPGERS